MTIPPLQQAPPLVCQDGPNRSISPASYPDFGAVETMSIPNNHIPLNQDLEALSTPTDIQGAPDHTVCAGPPSMTLMPRVPHTCLTRRAPVYSAEDGLVMVA